MKKLIILSALMFSSAMLFADATQDALKQAKDTYEKSCQNGDANSCTALGAMYQSGQGVSMDNAKAKEYYQKACDLGQKQACDLAKVIQ